MKPIEGLLKVNAFESTSKLIVCQWTQCTQCVAWFAGIKIVLNVGLFKEHGKPNWTNLKVDFLSNCFALDHQATPVRLKFLTEAHSDFWVLWKGNLRYKGNDALRKVSWIQGNHTSMASGLLQPDIYAWLAFCWRQAIWVWSDSFLDPHHSWVHGCPILLFTRSHHWVHGLNDQGWYQRQICSSWQGLLPLGGDLQHQPPSKKLHLLACR